MASKFLNKYYWLHQSIKWKTIEFFTFHVIKLDMECFKVKTIVNHCTKIYIIDLYLAYFIYFFKLLIPRKIVQIKYFTSTIYVIEEIIIK